jgi:hypothetical protein
VSAGYDIRRKRVVHVTVGGVGAAVPDLVREAGNGRPR